MKDFLEGIPGLDLWKIEQDCNYMLDIQQFEAQRDDFSCGFYVLNSIFQFADITRNLPNQVYRHYDEHLTEAIRECCVARIVEVVLQLDRKEDCAIRGVCDKDVLEFLNGNVSMHVVGVGTPEIEDADFSPTQETVIDVDSTPRARDSFLNLSLVISSPSPSPEVRPGSNTCELFLTPDSLYLPIYSPRKPGSEEVGVV